MFAAMPLKVSANVMGTRDLETMTLVMALLCFLNRYFCYWLKLFLIDIQGGETISCFVFKKKKKQQLKKTPIKQAREGVMENREGFCSVDFSCLKRQVHLFSPTFLLTFIHLFMAHWKSRISAHSSTCSISPPYSVSQDKWSADRWRSGVSGKTGRKGKDGQKRKIMESHWVISRRDSEWEEGKRRKACIKVWKLQKIEGREGWKEKEINMWTDEIRITD